MINVFENISDVLNANVVSDSFKEDDDLIHTEVGAPVSINLIEQFDEILINENKLIRSFISPRSTCSSVVESSVPSNSFLAATMRGCSMSGGDDSHSQPL